ncbi:MAG: MBOAT family O-acyltransferase [Pseudomonadota bacterium]
MTIEVSTILLASVLLAMISWILPSRYALDGVVIGTLATLALFSPETVAWCLGASACTFAALKAGDAFGHKGRIIAGLALALMIGFTMVEFSQGLFWIGVSFFTLRLLHVACEWWLGSLSTPSARDFARYLFFLPVMIVGPIHRLPNFQRQVDRRRFDWPDWLGGFERCLVGVFMAYFLGDVVFGRVHLRLMGVFGKDQSFAEIWALSAIDWIKLYFVFAGLSAVALGASRMMGLTLEENFNKPWRATSLLDFWTRWHMTLTNWCRDYTYRPVMAITRNPAIGVIAAMLVIGLWHAISVYYVLWSIWQSLGIIISQLAAQRLPERFGSGVAGQLLVLVGILGWLSLARPVIVTLTGGIDDAFGPIL